MADPVWFKELADVLKCPVCCKTFREPPIYLCENQHGMCFKCRTSVMNPEEELAVICCPVSVCKGKLTEKRNYYVEKILDKLPKPKKCKHENCNFQSDEAEVMIHEAMCQFRLDKLATKCRFEGCGFKTSHETLAKAHEVKCQHRLVPCGHCNTQISLQMLTQHLDEVNNQWPISKDRESITLGTRLPIHFNFLYTGMWRLSIRDTPHQFYLHMNQRDKDYMHVWVSCSLPVSKAANYKYTINVPGPKSLCYTREMDVVSCDVPFGDMKKYEMVGVRCIKKQFKAFITIQTNSDKLIPKKGAEP